jgi:uncharacterized protein (TIGR03437 family)
MVRSIGCVLIAVAAASCAVDDGPHLDDITPASGSAGERVVLTGTRLCGDRGVTDSGACEALPVGHVSFGIDPQVDAGIVAWSDERIEALVPMSAPIGDVLVVVTVDGRTSNGISFRVQ